MTKKILSILLVFSMLVPMFPADEVFATDFGWVPHGVSTHSASPDVRPANHDTFKVYGIVVYGSPSDVPGNDLKVEGGNAQFRYHGWNYFNQLVTNENFPPDKDSGRHPKEKNWIFQPWTLDGGEHMSYNPWSIDSEYVSLRNRLYGHHGWAPHNSSSWSGYAFIQVPPSLRSTGSARMVHRTSDQRTWYETFTIPRLDEKVNRPPPSDVTVTVSDPTPTIGATDSHVLVDVTVSANWAPGGSNEVLDYQVSDIDSWTLELTFGTGTRLTETIEGSHRSVSHTFRGIKFFRSGGDPWISPVAWDGMVQVFTGVAEINFAGGLGGFGSNADIATFEVLGIALAGPADPTPPPMNIAVDVVAPEEVDVGTSFNVTSNSFIPPDQTVTSSTLEMSDNRGNTWTTVSGWDGNSVTQSKAEGTYIYRLSISTDLGKSGTDETTVRVADNRSTLVIANFSAPRQVFEFDTFQVFNQSFVRHGNRSYGIVTAVELGYAGNVWHNHNFPTIGGNITAGEVLVGQQSIIDIGLTVTGKSGTMDIAQQYVKVLPLPTGSIRVSGTLKENRKVVISTSSRSHPSFPIKVGYPKITVNRLDNTANSYKISAHSSNNYMFERAGEYEIVLKLRDTRNNTFVSKRVINIKPDLDPVANIDVARVSIIRDPATKLATFDLFDNFSFSPDSDSIEQRIWSSRFDNDNNGFQNDLEYIHDSGSLGRVQIPFDIVGDYKFSLEVVERFGTFDRPDPILPEFFPQPKRSKESVNVQVRNVRPTAELGTFRRHMVDLQLVGGGSSFSDIETNVSCLTAELAGRGILADISFEGLPAGEIWSSPPFTMRYSKDIQVREIVHSGHATPILLTREATLASGSPLPANIERAIATKDSRLIYVGKLNNQFYLMVICLSTLVELHRIPIVVNGGSPRRGVISNIDILRNAALNTLAQGRFVSISVGSGKYLVYDLSNGWDLKPDGVFSALPHPLDIPTGDPSVVSISKALRNFSRANLVNTRGTLFNYTDSLGFTYKIRGTERSNSTFENVVLTIHNNSGVEINRVNFGTRHARNRLQVGLIGDEPYLIVAKPIHNNSSANVSSARFSFFSFNKSTGVFERTNLRISRPFGGPSSHRSSVDSVQFSKVGNTFVFESIIGVNSRNTFRDLEDMRISGQVGLNALKGRAIAFPRSWLVTPDGRFVYNGRDRGLHVAGSVPSDINRGSSLNADFVVNNLKKQSLDIVGDSKVTVMVMDEVLTNPNIITTESNRLDIDLIAVHGHLNSTQARQIVGADRKISNSLPTSTIIRKIADFIEIEVGNNKIQTQRILVDDIASFQGSFWDFESDLIDASRWRFVHDPSVYDNPTSRHPNSGVDLTAIRNADGTMNIADMSFDGHVGRFHTMLQVKDNPIGPHEGYWSSEGEFYLYVHRRPEVRATFSPILSANKSADGTYKENATLVVNTSSSFDPDYQHRRVDRGIARFRVLYRHSSDTIFTDTFNRSNFLLDKAGQWEFRVQVEDIYGAWSDTHTELITVTGAGVIQRSISASFNLPAVVDVGENINASRVVTPINTSLSAERIRIRPVGGNWGGNQHVGTFFGAHTDFDVAGEYEIEYRVTSIHNQSDTIIQRIEVRPINILADIEITESLVQNRTTKFSVVESQGNKFPVTGVSWSFTPISGGATSDINKQASGRDMFTAHRQTGEYRVVAVVSVVAHGETVEKIFTKDYTITEDFPPMLSIVAMSEHIRDENGIASANVVLDAASTDDIIGSTSWQINYDHDGNNVFRDTDWRTLGAVVNQATGSILLDKGVGQYKLRVTITEEFNEHSILGDPSGRELSVTAEKILSVVNVTPSVSMLIREEVVLAGEVITLVDKDGNIFTPFSVSTMFDDPDGDLLGRHEFIISQNRAFMPTQDEISILEGYIGVNVPSVLDKAGEYTISYSVWDAPSGAGIVDTKSRQSNIATDTVIVHRPPVAELSFTPIANINHPTIPAQWYFGDGKFLEGTTFRVDNHSNDPDGFALKTNQIRYRRVSSPATAFADTSNGTVFGLSENEVYLFEVSVTDSFNVARQEFYTVQGVKMLDLLADARGVGFNISALPASESLELFDIETDHAHPVRLEVELLHSGTTDRVVGTGLTHISQNTGSGFVNGNSFSWNNLQLIVPDTTVDGLYTLRLKAISDNDRQFAIRDFPVTVNTPINLVPNMPILLVANDTVTIRATTSIYVNNLTVELFECTAHAVLLPMNSTIIGNSKYWTVDYTVPDSILEGDYMALFRARTSNNNTEAVQVPFRVETLKIDVIMTVGNDFMPRLNNFGNSNALAGDKIFFTIATEGYADWLEIVVDPEIIAQEYRTARWYSEDVDHPIVLDVNENVFAKTNIMTYIVRAGTDETVDKENLLDFHGTRIREPYTFIIRAWRGSTFREIELFLDISGDVRQLLRPGIRRSRDD
ncbi:MAG: Athe_2463 domain-containing protein [Alkaliphilus sp.]